MNPTKAKMIHFLSNLSFQSNTGNPKEDLVIKAAYEILKARFKITSEDLEESKTAEERLIEELKIATPSILLAELSGGAEPSGSDLRMIEEAKDEFDINNGVMNVIIYYVLLKGDMKLKKGDIRKVSERWSSLGITTVEDAMIQAKKESK